jgi:tetratricopeptide (TPR) repeat protein
MLGSRAAVLLAVGLVLGAGCASERSEREQLAQARVLAADGDVEAARALLESVAAASPDDAEVQTRYAAFLLDQGETDRAGDVLDAVIGADMTEAVRARWNTERDRFGVTTLDASRGDELGRPRDRRRYERALLNQIDVHDGGEALAEYHAYWMARAWLALGAATGEGPATAEAGLALVERITPGQGAEALEALSRVLDGDPTWSAPRPPAPEVVADADAVRERVLRRQFADAFHRDWRRTHEQRLVDEGRFDPTREQFLYTYRGPAPAGATPEEPSARLAWLAQTYIARDATTALAYELAGASADGTEPLPFAMTDFAEVEVTGAEFVGDAFVATVRVPFAVVETAAYLLERRVNST